MITTDPEHGTREWEEYQPGDLLKIRQKIIDAAKTFAEDIKCFYESLKDLTDAILWLEKPDWAIHNKRRYRTRKVRQKLHLNTVPLGTSTYLYKAKAMKNLARSTKTTSAPQKGKQKNEQCRHTFRITSKRCAPCDGYNKECDEYTAAHDHP